MKKILTIAILLILIISNVVFASGAFWAQGWSDVLEIGTTIREMGITRWIEYDNNVYYLMGKQQDHGILVQLRSYSLEEGTILETSELFTASNGLKDVYFTSIGDYLYVVFVDDNNELWEYEYNLAEASGNLVRLHKGRRGISQVFLFEVNNQRHYLWSEAFEGSTNIFHGKIEEGKFKTQLKVFLGDDFLNKVEDVLVQDDRALISWVADGSRRDGAGPVKVYITEFDGTNTETKVMAEYSGKESGRPRFLILDNELFIHYEYQSSASLGGHSQFKTELKNIDTKETYELPLIPGSIDLDIHTGSLDSIQYVASNRINNVLEIVLYEGNLLENNIVHTRLTYDANSFVNPKIITYQGYKYVFFEQGITASKSLMVINNKFEGNPSMWRKIGLDENNLITSMLYYFFRNLFLACFYTTFLMVFIVLIWGVIFLGRKYNLLSSASQNYKAAFFQIIFSCLVMTFAISLLYDYTYTSYQVFSSILSIVLITSLILLSKLKYEDIALPLSLTSYTIIYIFLMETSKIASFLN